MFHKLRAIATESLHACYADDKVVASPTHFSDFWARDTFWALPGMLVAGDHASARACLKYFFDHQRSDGKVPRKLSRDINVLKYIFGRTIKRIKPRPTYHGLVKPFHAVDSELLLLIALERYLDETRDYDFAEEYYGHAKKAIGWHMERLKEGFVHEYFLGNWMDTVFKFGPVLYTNVLYVRALEAMVTIAQVAGNDDDAEVYLMRARRAKRRVREHFWYETHFVDELRLKGRDTFDLAGNVMALLWGLADHVQQPLLLERLKQVHSEYGAWMPAVPSGQPFWKINPVVRLFGIGDYHTQTSWLWITVLVARAMHKHGEKSLAEKILTDTEGVALRDGEVGETYVSDGTQYKKLLWQSATPFAWSSGMTLETLFTNGYADKAKEYEKPEPRIC